MNNRADLHTHTTASDGMNRPSDNVRLAKEAGLSAVAITDHDTTAGIPEALEAGEQYGIIVVPGVEISTAHTGRDVHILGYGIAYEDALLRSRLLSLRNVRNRRNEQIISRLTELGMPISIEEVEAAAGKSARGDDSVGRPHIAQVLVSKGYVSDMRDAFDRFLGEGKAAYVSPPRISPLEAVGWIHDAGGIAIVAHPGLYDNDALVVSLLQGGADGLEAYHSDHDAEDEARYASLAERYNKLITGGSDFHGAREGVVFHGPIGHKTVDAAIVQRVMRS